MESISIPARADNLNIALEFIENVMARVGLGGRCRNAVVLASEEIFANIVHYAYPSAQGDVAISAEARQGTLTLVFSDSGIPFNPLNCARPDLLQPVEDREIGGLGVFLTTQMMDEVAYQHCDGHNILTVRKYF